MNTSKLNKIKGAIFGLICCDALGTTNEFKERGTFKHVTDIVGGGPFRLKAGEWTDDSSLALCMIDSFINKNAFSPQDQLTRYSQWMYSGYLSSNGSCFDIGMTTRTAITKFISTRDVFCGQTDDMSAGNGSIMRLIAVPAFYNRLDCEKTVAVCGGLSSLTTHGHEECLDACKYMSYIIWLLLNGATKDDIFSFKDVSKLGVTSGKIQRIANGSYKYKSDNDISTSGYVIDTLEAAMWGLYHTETFKDGALKLVNMGDDADTVGAVYGQIAGAYYGFDNIPQRWVNKLAKLEMIKKLTNDFIALC